MTQDEINQREWQNPDNWSNRVFPALYFSKADQRLLVPKPIPTLGWTLNLAHRSAAMLFVGTLWVPALGIIAALALSR